MKRFFRPMDDFVPDGDVPSLALPAACAEPSHSEDAIGNVKIAPSNGLDVAHPPSASDGEAAASVRDMLVGIECDRGLRACVRVCA